jgi:HK97 gp10 family phage protein
LVLDTQTLHGLDDVLAKLKSLPPEIVSKSGGPVKSALLKGAKVIADEAVQNIRRVTQPDEGQGYVPTGLLAKSVVVRRDPKPQKSGANERYRVMLSRKKYPGRNVGTIATGRFLEFGTEKQPAEPWMGPAYLSKRQLALDTVVRELNAGIDRIVRKLSRQKL